MSLGNRILSALVVICVFSFAVPAIAQLYWCPVCRGNTHHYDGHPHFQAPQGNRDTRTPNTYGVVTIHNASAKSMSYFIRSHSGGGWSSATINSGGSQYHWYRPAGNFTIQFGSGNQNKSYNLNANTIRGRQPRAADGRSYSFKMSSGRVDLIQGKATKRRNKTSSKEAWRKPLDQGIALYRQGKMHEAAAKFREGDLTSPLLADWLRKATAGAFKQNGDHYYRAGNYRKALENYESSYQNVKDGSVKIMIDLARRGLPGTGSKPDENRIKQLEADRLAEIKRKDEADRLAEIKRKDKEAQQARDKVSGILSDLAGKYGGNSNSGGGLDFDGKSVDSGAGELDFAGAVKGANRSDPGGVGQSRFSKGGRDSAPVPLGFADFSSQSKSGADVIAHAKRINFQRRIRPDSGDGPPAEGSGRALPNPLDEERINRERAVIRPLNMIEFGKLSQLEATSRANARVEANRNEASRLAQKDLEDAWDKLRKSGQLGAEENPWKKSKTDTDFKAKFDAVVRGSARKEDQRMREARRVKKLSRP